MADEDLETRPARASRLPGYVIGVIFLLGGVVLLLGSLGFPDAVGRSDPGPAFLPRVVGVGLLVCSIAHLLKVPAPASEEEEYPQGNALLRIGLVLAAMVAYAYVLREVGFILTTLLFLLITLWLAHVRRPILLVLLPLIGALGLHFAFAEMLNVPLPRGVIEGWLP